MKILKSYAVLLATIALALSALCGCKGGNATVTGTVKDTITGINLAGATVRIGSSSAQTDFNGQYELSRVPAGDQVITSQKTGYADYSAAITVNSRNNSYDINMIVPVSEASLPVSTSYWQIAGFGGSGPLLDSWSLETDPRYKYYKVKTPLASRQQVGDNKTGIVVYIGFSTDTTPIAMDIGENELTNKDVIHNFTHWARTDRFVYFGGYIYVGGIMAPAPGWIKAAHQNGVPILGCIFFNWDQADQGSWILNTFDSKTRQQCAAKLAAIAKAYGFDGYFINEEADRGKEANNIFAQFIKDLHNAGTAIGYPLKITWYQVHAGNFTPDVLVLDNAQNTDYVFLDYDWQYEYDVIYKEFLNYPPFSSSGIEAGIDMTSYTKSPPLDLLKQITPEGGAALFAFNALTTSDLDTLGKIDYKYSTYMNEMSDNYTTLRTSLTALPFVSFFNTGQGDEYFVGGKCISNEKWNDMGQQDILPSYCLFNEAGQKDFIYDDAFYGGSSLFVARGSATTRRLYEANLPIFSSAKLQVAYKYRGDTETDTPWQIELEIASGGSTTTKTYTLSYQSGDWTEATFDLSDIAGSTVVGISAGAGADSDILLGKLFIGVPAAPVPVTGITQTVQEKNRGFYTTLVWTGDIADFAYEIYDGDNFLGRTNQNAYTAFTYYKPEHIRIVPVSFSGQR